jgi:hypothetical protein
MFHSSSQSFTIAPASPRLLKRDYQTKHKNPPSLIVSLPVRRLYNLSLSLRDSEGRTVMKWLTKWRAGELLVVEHQEELICLRHAQLFLYTTSCGHEIYSLVNFRKIL